MYRKHYVYVGAGNVVMHVLCNFNYFTFLIEHEVKALYRPLYLQNVQLFLTIIYSVSIASNTITHIKQAINIPDGTHNYKLDYNKSQIINNDS